MVKKNKKKKNFLLENFLFLLLGCPTQNPEHGCGAFGALAFQGSADDAAFAFHGHFLGLADGALGLTFDTISYFWHVVQSSFSVVVELRLNFW